MCLSRKHKDLSVIPRVHVKKPIPWPQKWGDGLTGKIFSIPAWFSRTHGMLGRCGSLPVIPALSGNSGALGLFEKSCLNE